MTCPICKSDNHWPTFTARGKYPYHKCGGDCGCMFMLDQSPVENESFYGPEYFEGYMTNPEAIKHSVEEPARALHTLPAGIKFMEPEFRVLEVGCGLGQSLSGFRAMQKNPWNVTALNQPWKTCGIEVGEASSFIARSQGHNVITGDFEKLTVDEIRDKSGQKEFDIILSIHSIEHMTGPIEALQKMGELLRKDRRPVPQELLSMFHDKSGIIYVHTPNIEYCKDANWYHFAPRGEHKILFSAKTLHYVADMAGLTVQSYQTWHDDLLAWLQIKI